MKRVINFAAAAGLRALGAAAPGPAGGSGALASVAPGRSLVGAFTEAVLPVSAAVKGGQP
jgi:hypothetical protein